MSLFKQLSELLSGPVGTTEQDTWDSLRHRVTVLSERAWEGRNTWPEVEAWLSNFDGRTGLPVEVEQLHALFLLSQFLYIGSAETRVLLRAIYRDLFLVPLVQEVRAELGGTRDIPLLTEGLKTALSKTRFLGVGNPSESGVHLLYYFRQENGLSKGAFLDSASIFRTVATAAGGIEREIANPNVERYVFVDDVCGSGQTAVQYSNNILAEIAEKNPDVKLHYLAMLASVDGMNRVRTETRFGANSGAIFELDETYRCLSDQARIMLAAPPHVDREKVRMVALIYGQLLWQSFPGGFDDNQLLLGFHHNTPDNTLPIMWFEGTIARPWKPAFRRYHKM